MATIRRGFILGVSLCKSGRVSKSEEQQSNNCLSRFYRPKMAGQVDGAIRTKLCVCTTFS